MVIEKSNKAKRSTIYAFNVDSKQLDYEDKQLKEKNLELSYQIDYKKNPVSSLNEGKLVVDLTLKNQLDPLNIATRQITLSGFKARSETLKNIIDTKSDVQADSTNNDYSLTLQLKTDKANTDFVTIEELNKKSTPKKSTGLATWLQKNTLDLNAV